MKWMVCYHVDFVNGRSENGSMIVPSATPAGACSAGKGKILKHLKKVTCDAVEDVSIMCLGPASV